MVLQDASQDFVEQDMRRSSKYATSVLKAALDKRCASQLKKRLPKRGFGCMAELRWFGTHSGNQGNIKATESSNASPS